MASFTPSDLQARELNLYNHNMTDREFGKLVKVWGRRFPFFRPYLDRTPIGDRSSFFIIRTNADSDATAVKRPPSDEEMDQITEFVNGFMAGVRSVRVKKITQ